MRKPIIAGNWKMNKTVAEATALIEELKPLVKKADEDGVKVCMEFFDNEKSAFTNGEELSVFLEAIPELGCTFDVGNLAAAGDSVSEWLDKLKDRIVHFHFKDKTCTDSELTAGKPKILYGGKPLYDIATGY